MVVNCVKVDDKEELPDGGKSTFRFALMLCNIHMYLCIRYYSAAVSERSKYVLSDCRVIRRACTYAHAQRFYVTFFCFARGEKEGAQFRRFSPGELQVEATKLTTA